MRTNNKQVKEAIQKYIMEILAAEDLTIIEAYEKFKTEKKYELQRNGDYHTFISWLEGLGLSIDFYHDEVREIVKNWLQQSDKEAAKYENHKTWYLFLYLFTREFFTLLNKEQKNHA
jgi:hypothetical protein